MNLFAIAIQFYPVPPKPSTVLLAERGTNRIQLIVCRTFRAAPFHELLDGNQHDLGRRIGGEPESLGRGRAKVIQ